MLMLTMIRRRMEPQKGLSARLPHGHNNTLICEHELLPQQQWTLLQGRLDQERQPSAINDMIVIESTPKSTQVQQPYINNIL